jgi:hypothetical protein
MFLVMAMITFLSIGASAVLLGNIY